MSRFISIFWGLFFVVFMSNNVSVFAQAPTIIEQPSQILECTGSEASLKIITTGTAPLTYEWYKDNTPLGINASQVHFEPLTTEHNGEYYCNVSNAEGNVDSELISVTAVENAPVINSITTVHDHVCVGTDNLITVDITGYYSHVKWYLQDAFVGYGNPINYTITNAQQSDAGNYYCEVYNICGETTSETVNIDIVSPANIVTQPISQTICEGEDVYFNPVAEGDYLNYMWFADDDMMIGETSAELIITSPSFPHLVQYKFMAYNICNSVTSNGVFVTIQTPPNITGHPVNHQECFGEDVTLYANATANIPITYQWYDENNQLIDGATTTSIGIELLENDTAYYYCEISNDCGTVYTDAAQITTLMPPEITQQPVGDELCVGDNITMQLKAIGFEPISYQWQFNGADVNGSNISGDETQAITISSITEGQQGVYTCHVSNACGFVMTEDAIVTVNTPPLITEQPEGVEICAEEELLISFNSSGTQPISFEWMILESENSIGIEADYYTASANTENSGSYYCLLSNVCAEVSTDIIAVDILALPQITTHPENELVCAGDYASMMVEAEGAEPLEFLWYRNNSAASGQTNSLLEYTSAQINQAGEYYCRVMNGCGYDDSGTAILTVVTVPVITSDYLIDQTICENDMLNLYINPQGDNYTFQWYLNDLPLSGEHDTILNITNTPGSMAGTYFCSAHNICATVYSDTIEVTIHPAPEMSLGNDIDLCEGESIVIGPAGDYIQYNWNNGLSIEPSLDVHLPGTYILEVTGANSCKNRDTLIVSFHPYHQILFDDTEIISCGPYTLNAGEGAYEYTWNTDPVETSPSIVISESGTYAVTVTGDAYGCSASQGVYVDIRESISIDLGNDKTVPVDSYIDIGVEEEFAQYIWNTGYTGPILTVYGSNYGVGEHEFWLTVTAQNECTASDTIKVKFWDNLGVGDTKTDDGIMIFPNPTKDYLTISDISYTIDNIEILNVTGQVIKSFLVNSNEITLNLSNFAEGIYLIKLKRNNETITKKILIR